MTVMDSHDTYSMTNNEAAEAHELSHFERYARRRENRTSCEQSFFPCQDCAWLQDAFHASMLRLSLVADGAVSRLRERVSGGGPENNGPGTSELLGDIRAHLRHFGAARTHVDKLQVIADVCGCLRSLQHSRTESSLTTEEWELRIARDIRPNAMLIEIYGVTERQIARLRKRHGVSKARGRVIGYNHDQSSTGAMPSKVTGARIPLAA